jgi:hypothetical protein
MGEVLIPYGDSAKDTATLLLGAADDAGFEPYVVRHQPDDAGFRVPEEVAKKAKLKPVDEEAQAQVAEEERAAELERANAEANPEPEETEEKSSARRTTKKAAAKKTAAKKTSK